MTKQLEQHLVIFGCGFSGEVIGERSGADFASVTGTTRSEDRFDRLKRYGISPCRFDGVNIDDALHQALARATHLVVSIAPNDEGDQVLAALAANAVAMPALKWIGYLSTVGVYGNHDGAWVDEDTPVNPVSKRSIQRVDAENAWQAFAKEHSVDLAIFRLSGIYGPGRNAFMNIEKGRARRLVKPGQVFNRIHRDDIAAAVHGAIARAARGIFNITDDEPAPPQDVVTFAHELMGLEPPPEQDFETAELSVMARSFYGENKRVSNARSKTELGITYQWPNYRESLERMWREGSWKPD